mmetsp:Transcript_23030/g.63875  ORF Transcript_23030/g.63875 Transcript_23030/m.63875 type:complete len:224 (-) Transcript_23030:36-707(-)
MRDITALNNQLLLSRFTSAGATLDKEHTRQIIEGCFEALVFLNQLGDRETHRASFILRHVLETLTNALTTTEARGQASDPSCNTTQWKTAIACCLLALKTDKSQRWRAEGRDGRSFCRAAVSFFLRCYRNAADDNGRFVTSVQENEQVVLFCVDRLRRYPRKIPTIAFSELLVLCQVHDKKFVRERSGLCTVLTGIIESKDVKLQTVKLFANTLLKEFTEKTN